MPIPIIIKGITEGLSSIPHAYTVLKTAPWVLLLVALKMYFGGARNQSERLMHSKVVMVTGGTSGIGASVVHELALRGAQIILLTRQPPSDGFLAEYIQDVRQRTGNQLIYAEQVDLSSLHSIRTFATKWVDNAPPRRLDMLILCGGLAAPSAARGKHSPDGLDEEWQVNYLANFHLLSILSPALRVQPPDRDVRIIFTTCSSYIGAKYDLKQITDRRPGTNGKGNTNKKKKNESAKKEEENTPVLPSKANIFGLSKLALMIFAQSFQKHLNAYARPDKFPPNARILVVNPGLCRTPGTRRWLTGGTLWGLLVYLLTWPLWWLVLKSPQQGAQSILFAAMEARFGRGAGGYMIKECVEVDVARTEVKDEKLAEELWKVSEAQITEAEKTAALKRAADKAATKEKTDDKNQESQGSKEQTAGSRRNRKKAA
ncbi:hypothetical protein ASPZODRAFT_86463 [Penicilliopsis zonata CBS 506.65]|uniref:Ketoreductase (KR) domain-containing protein n=1 Tax=Penicilliopsis zonata CBS 506.65 TaxID=1073090 RepID=A0A1L9SUM0_9EURO|nr:hypothetical protein ASPZODRAFT_86463 [Penicilliopsis zonata CBS 506.65]OJJ50821.1 hypothetical protein ASPZODRAFT_86463 [Penicilliopsis zonata CBS 506.65]